MPRPAHSAAFVTALQIFYIPREQPCPPKNLRNLCHLWIQKTAHLRSLAAAFFEEVLQDGAAFGFEDTGLYFGAVIEIGMVQDRKD